MTSILNSCAPTVGSVTVRYWTLKKADRGAELLTTHLVFLSGENAAAAILTRPRNALNFTVTMQLSITTLTGGRVPVCA